LPRPSWDPVIEKPFFTNQVSNVCFPRNISLAMSGKREQGNSRDPLLSKVC